MKRLNLTRGGISKSQKEKKKENKARQKERTQNKATIKPITLLFKQHNTNKSSTTFRLHKEEEQKGK